MTENNGTAGGQEPAYRKVYVTRANAFKASKWLRKNRDELVARGLTKQQIADECKVANQISAMTGKHIESICADFGIAPMWVKRMPAVKRDRTEGYASRGQSSRIVAVELINVADELARLYAILGETFEPYKTFNLSALRQVIRGHNAKAVEIHTDPPATPEPESEPAEPLKPGTVRVVH